MLYSFKIIGELRHQLFTFRHDLPNNNFVYKQNLNHLQINAQIIFSKVNQCRRDISSDTRVVGSIQYLNICKL